MRHALACAPLPVERALFDPLPTETIRHDTTWLRAAPEPAPEILTDGDSAEQCLVTHYRSRCHAVSTHRIDFDWPYIPYHFAACAGQVNFSLVGMHIHVGPVVAQLADDALPKACSKPVTGRLIFRPC